MNRFAIVCFLYIVSLTALLSGNDNTDKTVVLTSKNYSKKIASTKAIIVDAWAPWCGPCRKVRPVLNEVSAEKNIDLGTLNVDVYSDFAKNQLNITNIPTLIFYKNGVEVKRLVGVFTKDEIGYMVDVYLK